MHCTEATSYPCWHRFAKVPPMLMTSSSGCGDITRMRMPFTTIFHDKAILVQDKTRQDSDNEVEGPHIQLIADYRQEHSIASLLLLLI